MRQALELALEALQFALHVGFPESSESQIKKGEKAYQQHRAAITAIKEALAQPEEEKLHPVHIGVDVTKEGTAVTAFYRKPDAVMEMFYSQFHPLAQPEQPKVRTGDCLLVGVCASEGHKIQVKQEPWRESASDYERGVIDGRQMQAQSSVDKAVNRMAQPEQEPVATLDDLEQEIYENTRQFVSRDVMEWMLKRYYTNPPQRKPLTDEMIVAGGKALAKLHAESCGLDFDDVWKYYAEDHKADAKAVIEAAHGIKE